MNFLQANGWFVMQATVDGHKVEQNTYFVVESGKEREEMGE